MILKYKYHSDSGLLEAYRSYTLAQNNSLSDTIVITSTAPDAERYNYCLEFICYNSKSIPKAQYISPILNYGDEGISFAVPNNLTEFRGHVDMQLTGYDPDDNSIVFKSISKNCKAFEIEGSLCVLEKDLNDTPNVFTEVLKQLEELGNMHQDIIDEAMEQFSAQILDMVAKYRWCKVRYYDNGKLIEEQWVTVGSKLTPPQYTLPQHCVLVGGWYNPATQTLWDLDEDTVEGATELYLNYMTDNVEISSGVVYGLGYYSRQHIYLPEYYQGYTVTSIWDETNTVPYECHVHFGNNIEYFDILMLNSNVQGLYFPDNNPTYLSREGYLYVQAEGRYGLIYAPKFRGQDELTVMDGCIAIGTLAICNISGLKKLNLPNCMQYFSEYSIANTNLETLHLPAGVNFVSENAVVNNFNLKDVIADGDIAAAINDNSFFNVDDNGVITRPKIWVRPEYYDNFKSSGLSYDVGIIGQDFFDGRYAQKEN